jgi:AcrR family transcriptional regulator
VALGILRKRGVPRRQRDGGNVTEATRRKEPAQPFADRPKVGRPARLNRAMIARAAYEVGLDRVTMKGVADRLGVSVPGLYHHVEGRDDLMRLAAEYSAAQMELPVDHGQHWTAWLLECARYSHDAFVAQPALLAQFVNGSLGFDRMAVHMDTVIGVLTRHGFSAPEAIDAHETVIECALGAAVTEIRTAESARAGRPIIAEYHRVLAVQPPEALPHLRQLLSTHSPRADFTERTLTVLVGIAVRRGEPWQPILELRGDSSRVAPNADFMHP